MWKVWPIPFMRIYLSRTSTQCDARCSIFEDRVTAGTSKHTKISLSALAADLLVESKHSRWHDLQPKKHYEWHDFQGPGEPITGAVGAFITAFHEAVLGLSSIPRKIQEEHENSGRQQRKRKRKAVRDAMVLPGQIVQALGAEGPQANIENVNLLGEAEACKTTCEDFLFTKKALVDPEPTRQTKAVLVYRE